MVKVLVSEGNLESCLRVWEEMQRDGVHPDVMVYSTLIMVLCEGNQVDKGYELFKDMKERKYLIDRAIYGSLIEAYVANQKVGSACDLLKDLMDLGYRADLSINNFLIKGLCNVQHVNRAYKLLQETVQEDLQPDFSTMNPILVSHAELKRMDEFCTLLAQMQKLGNCVIDDLSKFFSFMVEKDDRVTLALEVFEYLKNKNYRTVSVYNIFMESLLKNGKMNKALELFRELNDSDLVPDSITYSNAILCYVEAGNIHEACTCCNRIIESSSIPSIDAYYSLGKGLSIIGEVDAVIELVCDCLAHVTSGPMEFKYTLTTIDVCKLNNGGKLIDVVNEMVEQGCPPNSVIYAAIIYGMCKHGTIEEARKVFASMRERKFLSEADEIVYDEILIDHMKKKMADLVLSGLKFFWSGIKIKGKGLYSPVKLRM